MNIEMRSIKIEDIPKGDELMNYILIGNLPDGASIEYVKSIVRIGFGDDATVRQISIGEDR